MIINLQLSMNYPAAEPRGIKMMNLIDFISSPRANTSRQPPVSPFFKGDYMPIPRGITPEQSSEEFFSINITERSSYCKVSSVKPGASTSRLPR